MVQVFIQLPVKDLDRSVNFFSKLGYKFNPDLTGDEASCMILNDTTFVMLMVEKLFVTFTKKEISDAAKSPEMVIAVSVESREKVDELVSNALKAGGTTSSPKQDTGWMYSQSFHDLDGHMWDAMYMDEAAVPENATIAALQWELRRNI